MHGLQEQYGEQVDFLHVDVENPGALEAVNPVGITGRTQYVLTDGAGNVVYRWFGIIEQADLEREFEELLTDS